MVVVDRHAAPFLSSFAYESLAFDLELDGWLQNAPVRTSSERAALAAIPLDEIRMTECRLAALAAGNEPVVRLTDIVLAMLALWRRAIESRPCVQEHEPETGMAKSGE